MLGTVLVGTDPTSAVVRVAIVRVLVPDVPLPATWVTFSAWTNRCGRMAD